MKRSAYRVVHLDAGRKYFSSENLRKFIDNCAAAGFGQLELYLSDHQGLRLALDDMRVLTPQGEYDLSGAPGDGFGEEGNEPDGTGKFLTEAEMDALIAYAAGKGVEIVPAFGAPGHLGAVLMQPDAGGLRYPGSRGSVDITRAEGRDFALALLEKYVKYFASRGCRFFNFCADEFANDLGEHRMGYEMIYQNGMYKEHFVPFFNAMAALVKRYGMTPRCFNDGVYYNEDSEGVEPDRGVEVCYWTHGWEGYRLASAAYLAAKGFKLINADSAFYWVLGKNEWPDGPAKAAGFEPDRFNNCEGSTEADGAMMCFWCDMADSDGPDEGAAVVEKTAGVVAEFGRTLERKCR